MAVFTVFFTSQGTSPVEFFLGRYEPLPPELGTWTQTGVEERTGLLRETRLLLPGDNRKAGYLLRQVRYRNPATRAITRVEPEQKIPRRRVSARS